MLLYYTVQYVWVRNRTLQPQYGALLWAANLLRISSTYQYL